MTGKDIINPERRDYYWERPCTIYLLMSKEWKNKIDKEKNIPKNLDVETLLGIILEKELWLKNRAKSAGRYQYKHITLTIQNP